MKIDFIKILQADSVVAGGVYFKAVFNWWEITIVIFTIAVVIYLMRRKRKKTLS